MTKNTADCFAEANVWNAQPYEKAVAHARDLLEALAQWGTDADDLWSGIADDLHPALMALVAVGASFGLNDCACGPRYSDLTNPQHGPSGGLNAYGEWVSCS